MFTAMSSGLQRPRTQVFNRQQCECAGRENRQGLPWGWGCLPPGSRGQGRLQAGAAGAPEGDSCRSTHTGGLGPPGPGTENSRGCPWRSYRPPLGKTCRQQGSAPHDRCPLHTHPRTVVPTHRQALFLRVRTATASFISFIPTAILSDGSCLLAPFGRQERRLREVE